MALRIVFCGTPAFGLPTLKLLAAESDFSLEAVVTQPDRPRGRGQKSASSPIKEAALESGLHVYQPEKIKSDSAREFFLRLKPDAVVIIAYGQLIPRSLLEIPRLGWINLHASLLPRFRGAAPIQRAILEGEARTGLTTMQIDAGMDTGAILEQLEMEILPDETSPELADRMATLGAPLMLDTLRKFARGEISPRPQVSQRATLAPPLRKDEGQIDWCRSSINIYNQIRALQPWPGAFTSFRRQSCAIWGRPAAAEQVLARNLPPGTLFASNDEFFAACGEQSALRLDVLQLASRKKLAACEFFRGARPAPGERFDS